MPSMLLIDCACACDSVCNEDQCESEQLVCFQERQPSLFLRVKNLRLSGRLGRMATWLNSNSMLCSWLENHVHPLKDYAEDLFAYNNNFLQVTRFGQAKQTEVSISR